MQSQVPEQGSLSDSAVLPPSLESFKEDQAVTQKIYTKQRMQQINKSLTEAIDKIRFLEGENSLLKTLNEQSKSGAESKLENLLKDFEAKLFEKVAQIEAISQEKDKLQRKLNQTENDLQKALANVAEKRENEKKKDLKMLDLSKRVHELESKLLSQKNVLETRSDDLKNQLNLTQSQEKQIEDLSGEIERMKIKNDEVELSNNILDEKLRLTNYVHAEEKHLADLKLKEALRFDYKTYWDQEISKAVKEIYNTHDEQIKTVKRCVDERYKRKISDAKASNLRTLDKLNALKKQNVKLQTVISELNRQLSNSGMNYDQMRQNFEKTLASTESELNSSKTESKQLIDIKNKLKLDVKDLEKKFQSLTETKITPDIETLERILKIPENLSNQCGASSQPDPNNPESHELKDGLNGCVRIKENDQSGQFIVLENTSNDKNIDISNWVLKKVDVDTGEEVSHVFDENTIIYPSEPLKLLVASNDSTSEIQGNEIPLDPAQWSNFAEKHQVKTILINREGFEEDANLMQVSDL